MNDSQKEGASSQQAGSQFELWYASGPSASGPDVFGEDIYSSSDFVGSARN